MNISRAEFEKLVVEAMDNLDEKAKKRMNNVAVFVEDEPTAEQLGKAGRGKHEYMLFGLFEGYGQSSRQNFGPVLPDQITLFRKPICSNAGSFENVRKQVIKTLRHEIAHHFGSDEVGARKATRNT